MQLSGNFELRPNHFHVGFDLKHNKRRVVCAVADGYVSRIKISTLATGKQST
jgi:hypothetical protein